MCFGGGSTPPMPAPAPQQLSGDVQAMADKDGWNIRDVDIEQGEPEEAPKEEPKAEPKAPAEPKENPPKA